MAKKVKKIAKNKDGKPKFDTRRPLDNMEVPEGTRLVEYNAPKSERNVALQTYVELFKAAMAEGMNRREIRKILGLNEDLFDKIEKQVINEDGQVEITKASPYRYYEYIQRQEKCIRDLEYFTNQVDSEIEFYKKAQKDFNSGKIEKLPSGRPNINAGIMAIKTKSDILDKMIKTGQELGIVEKRAKELRVSGNLNLAALPTEELKSLMSKKMKDMHLLVEKEKLPAVYTKMLPPIKCNDEEEKDK